MLRRAGVVLAWLLTGCAAARAPDVPPTTSALAVRREVTLARGTVHVLVEHDGDAAWAEYVADRAAAYLPAAERYLGVPFHEAAAVMFHDLPQPWTVRIVGRRHVALGDVHIRAYNNTYGVFGPDRGIFVEYSIAPIGNPAVVLHELTHDWFHGKGAALVPGAPRDDDEPAWFIEGLASMTPIAVADAGVMVSSTDERHAMRAHWGQWAIPPVSMDVAIHHDTRKEGGIPIFYGKSYRVQAILAHELGGEGYRALLQSTARHLPRSNDDVLALLHGQRADEDWRALLSGWVFDGPYGRYRPADVPGLVPER